MFKCPLLMYIKENISVSVLAKAFSVWFQLFCHCTVPDFFQSPAVYVHSGYGLSHGSQSKKKVDCYAILCQPTP